MRTNPITLLSTTFAIGLAGCAPGANSLEETGETLDEIYVEQLVDSLPNNFPLVNENGFAASYSTAGVVDFTGEFFTHQGSNGRACATCHAPEDAWSIRPATIHALFVITGGTHPIFNILDADRRDADLSTVSRRRNAFTMVRQGKFAKLLTAPATRDFDVVGASDPFGFGTTSNLWFFRRPLATANLRSRPVLWDGAATEPTVRDGLIRQARAVVSGVMGGPAAPDPVIFGMVDYELGISNAQTYVFGVGSLTAAGARGGPAAHSAEPFAVGGFDIFDAWQNSSQSRRRQVFRGQRLFNEVNTASGRRCGSCHNVANDGQNFAGSYFDIGASDPAVANSDMAVYTFQSRVTGEVLHTTDPGRGLRTGNFDELNRFKTPSLRGLSGRAPYFHNGIARDLRAVIRHYEAKLGFDFTPQEEHDLEAFLEAL